MSESDSPTGVFPNEEVRPSQTRSVPLEVLLETGGPAPKPVKTIQAALTHWKRRLLDLSKRNRLLNFKSTPVSTIALLDELPAEVFRTLWLRDGSMKDASPVRVSIAKLAVGVPGEFTAPTDVPSDAALADGPPPLTAG